MTSLGPLLQYPERLTPLVVAFLLATAGVAVARVLARRRRRRLLGVGAPRPGRGDGLLLLALAALCAALLGPRIGQRGERIEAAGADVVVLLDVSRSMLAEDAPPSRLLRARRAARAALTQLGVGDRAALAAFAGQGVLLTPLTGDVDALVEILPFLDAELLGPQGSELEAGMAAARSAFEPGSDARPRVVLLLSDGEDPRNRGVSATAAETARAGVRVISVAFGSEAGSRIPDDDGWLRDAYGREVETRRNAEAMARLAEITDGEALVADRWGEVEVAAVLRALHRDVSPAPGTVVERRVAAVRVAPLAALAFALLAFEAVGPRRRRAGTAGLATLALAATLGAAPPGERALEAHLRERPGDPMALVHLGFARAERGRNAEARRAFTAAALRARDPELAALAYHDLGVAAIADGDLEAARDAFLDAISLAPARRRSIYNLEWTLAALAQRPPPPAPGGPPQPDPNSQQEHRASPSQTDPGAPSPDPLTPEEVRRWLESVEDDAGRALRAAGRSAESRGHPKWAPGW